MSTMSRSCSRDIGSCQSVWNGDGWRAAGYQLEDENLKSEQFVSAFEVSQQWHVGGMAYVSLHCSRANHNRGYHPLLNNNRFLFLFRCSMMVIVGYQENTNGLKRF